MGGGSGGHITPIAAVIEQLRLGKNKDQLKDLEVRVWCDHKFYYQTRQLMPNDVRVDVISAGKLRRYANLKWWYRWFSPWHIVHTHLPNLVDIFKIGSGFIQSLVKLKLWQPDVVFCKGGYVSLPVGIVADFYHIPLVIHDSDTVPGLTNRILSKHATLIGTGAPVENYPNYPSKRTSFVGIPVRVKPGHLNSSQKQKLVDDLGLVKDKPIVIVTGGGLGAVALNEAVLRCAKQLIQANLQVVLVTGRKHHYNQPRGTSPNLKILEFTDRLTDYFEISDVVVTRAGATTMAELATLSAATVIVPSPYLAGDHQTKNAAVYDRAKAAIVLNEAEIKRNPELLAVEIIKLVKDKDKRDSLGNNLHKFAKPDAIDKMTTMIIKAGRIGQRSRR